MIRLSGQISVAQAARRGFASYKTIYKHVRSGALSAVKKKNLLLVEIAELLQFFGDPDRNVTFENLLGVADLARRWRITSQAIHRRIKYDPVFPRPRGKINGGKILVFSEFDVRDYEMLKPDIGWMSRAMHETRAGRPYDGSANPPSANNWTVPETAGFYSSKYARGSLDWGFLRNYSKSVKQGFTPLVYIDDNRCSSENDAPRAEGHYNDEDKDETAMPWYDPDTGITFAISYSDALAFARERLVQLLKYPGARLIGLLAEAPSSDNEDKSGSAS